VARELASKIVTVSFKGVPAALRYVSPTQINVLVPASTISGPVESGGSVERSEQCALHRHCHAYLS